MDSGQAVCSGSGKSGIPEPSTISRILTGKSGPTPTGSSWSSPVKQVSSSVWCWFSGVAPSKLDPSDSLFSKDLSTTGFSLLRSSSTSSTLATLVAARLCLFLGAHLLRGAEESHLQETSRSLGGQRDSILDLERQWCDKRLS